MKIILNGQTKKISGATDLRSLIKQFCKNPRHIVAELNGRIIKSDQWADKEIKDNDSLELITLVGGG